MVKLGYSSAFTWLMAGGIGWAGWQIVQSPPPLLDTLILVAFSFVMTDLISGLLHVILDNPRSLDVTALRGLAAGFQRHHEHPHRIYEMPLYEHLYVMHLPLTLLFLATLPLQSAQVNVVFLSMVLALHLMQMAHLWSHLPPVQVPRVVQALQRWNILLSKPRHDLHHTEPYDRDFCIMTGMCNPPLNMVVKAVGPTTHWWNAVFIAVALAPVGLAVLLA